MPRNRATDMRGQQRAKKKGSFSTKKYVCTYEKRVIIMDCVATTERFRTFLRVIYVATTQCLLRML